MNWIVANWYIVVILIAVLVTGIVAIMKFCHLPTKEQIANIKQWLLKAVVDAEKELGGGTGQLKLRQVYDLAITRFPWLQFISFETFSSWVDEALDQMKEMLDTNQNVKAYVGMEVV